MKVLFIASGNSSSKVRFPEPSIVVRNQAESLLEAGIDLDFFLIEGNGINGYVKNVSPLMNYLKENKYDIIHAHYGLTGIVSLLSRPQTPIVISYMGDDIMGIVGKSNRYKLPSKIFSVINGLLSRYLYDYSIVKSHNMKSRLIDKDEVHIIPNGVDLDRFYPVEKKFARNKLGWQINRNYLIWVSDPSRAEKNYSLAKQAVDKLDDDSIDLLILESVPNNKLYLYYSAADCLILTSFHEGSPNVIKEGMACNCPIVSTDVGDVRYVMEGTMGCYITGYSPEEVAQKIQEALAFAGTQNTTNGRERIQKLGLDTQSVARKIIDVYEQVLPKRQD